MADRADIEKMDKDIIELISRRSESYIRELKDAHEGDLFGAGERSRLFALIEECNKGPLSNDIVKKIYINVLSGSMAAVAPVTVAFLGPEGTFSAIAARDIFGEVIVPLPQRSFQDVFQQVETGAARYGVVPIENSTEGSVPYTLDELVETSLTIISEHYFRITYSLLSRCKDTVSIRKVYSHPQPLGQCKGWIRTNLSNAEIITVDSTSKAAELAAQEEGAAAIASGLAAQIYGLNTLASMIEDSRQNYTRFFIIGNRPAKQTGNDKTSIVCAVKDKPGALMGLLRPFSDGGINMTKIESRPDKKKIWEYNFFIDFMGHMDDISVQKALGKIKKETIFLKILGSYPVGTDRHV